MGAWRLAIVAACVMAGAGCAGVFGGIYNPDGVPAERLCHVAYSLDWPYNFYITTVDGVDAEGWRNPLLSRAFTRVAPGTRYLRWRQDSLGDYFASGQFVATLEAGQSYTVGVRHGVFGVVMWNDATGEIVSR